MVAGELERKELWKEFVLAGAIPFRSFAQVNGTLGKVENRESVNLPLLSQSSEVNLVGKCFSRPIWIFGRILKEEILSLFFVETVVYLKSVIPPNLYKCQQGDDSKIATV